MATLLGFHPFICPFVERGTGKKKKVLVTNDYIAYFSQTLNCTSF